ncbi:hypothetical protein OBBRIDRAFT_737646 [Obba rivulosa]|uniref:Uncharacterized protein n=1 Tax=Obba rivulosa TaxID=1052685 RepID=A0A8E2DL96_9APHY|nr:hypothetical protein OBBRIDRAFT_737646 [Obba rivulosa]
MAPLSFASSEIISLTIEAFLYGLYIMLLSRCIQVLLRKRQSDSLHTRLVIVTGSIFILVTWHLIIDFIRIIVSVDNSTEVAEVQLLFDDLRSIYSVMKTAVYVATTAISDAFIVYRCYIIWGRKIWVVVLPIVLLLTDIGTGIAAVASLALLNPGETYYVQHQTRITEAFLSITLALNGICTGLIAARIWWHQHTTREFREHSGLVFNLGHVATIMTESAAIYSATLLIMIATYVSEKTLAFNVFLDIVRIVYYF